MKNSIKRRFNWLIFLSLVIALHLVQWVNVGHHTWRVRPPSFWVKGLALPVLVIALWVLRYYLRRRPVDQKRPVIHEAKQLTRAPQEPPAEYTKLLERAEAVYCRPLVEHLLSEHGFRAAREIVERCEALLRAAAKLGIAERVALMITGGELDAATTFVEDQDKEQHFRQQLAELEKQIPFVNPELRSEALETLRRLRTNTSARERNMRLLHHLIETERTRLEELITSLSDDRLIRGRRLMQLIESTEDPNIRQILADELYVLCTPPQPDPKEALG